MPILLGVLTLALLAPLVLLGLAASDALRRRSAWAPFLRRDDGTYPLLVRGRRSRALAVLEPGTTSGLWARWLWFGLLAIAGVGLTIWLWTGPAHALGVSA